MCLLLGGGGDRPLCVKYKFVGYPKKVYFSEDVFSFMFYSYKKVMFPQKEFFAVFFSA